MGEWVFQVWLVVPDAEKTRVLVLGDGQLPCFTLERFYIHLYHLPRQIQETMGAEMVVLQTLTKRRDETAKVMDALVLIDNLTPDWKLPQDARWIDRAGLDGIMVEDWRIRRWMRRWQV